MTDKQRNIPAKVQRDFDILKEAALKAREVARATGTKLVISEDGVTKLVTAEELDARDLEQQAK